MRTDDITDIKLERATFAGGCFWCMEPPFKKLEGVRKVIPGYTGGNRENPTYEEVSSGTTGHIEAVEIEYDPSLISYEELLDVFWRQINPTDEGGQFADRGPQYRTAVFYHSGEQKRLAEESRKKLAESGRFASRVVTEIRPASRFYAAEEYHRDYYRKNPARYRMYRTGSGREGYLEKTWSAADDGPAGRIRKKNYIKPPDEKLKEILSPVQYEVTQKEGTERAFDNQYWDNKEEGIYVDVVSGEPLFSSGDKFDSGTGWPSFTRPLAAESIVKKEDRKLFMKRTEVKSAHAGSHLGHVFDDGPAPTGLRYCINSASLRFIPEKDLEKEGYGEYRALFNRQNDDPGP